VAKVVVDAVEDEDASGGHFDDDDGVGFVALDDDDVVEFEDKY
jgi:hypothetical protein